VNQSWLVNAPSRNPCGVNRENNVKRGARISDEPRAFLNVGTAITINRCNDFWTDWYCNDLGHNSSRSRDPNRIDYNGDRGRDRNDCHNVRLDNGYSANGRLDRSAAYCEKWILPS